MRTLLPEHPLARRAALYGAVAAVLALAVFVAAPGSGAGGRGTPMAYVFAGAVVGLVTSLFAVGMILIYRTMRFINFMQGLVGSLGAALLTRLLVFTPVPFPIALIAGLAVSVAVAAVAGVFLLRFFSSSRLFVTVVTIAGSLVVAGITGLVARMPFWPQGSEITSGQAQDLQSIGDDLPFQGLKFHVGSHPLEFGFAHLFAIEIAILALVGVGVFLRYTRAGTAVRAMAENPERAQLLGIGVGGLSVIVWMVAGALDNAAAVASFAAAPEVGAGFSALMIPFAAAVLARFRDIPTAVFAGVMLGIARFAWEFSFGDHVNAFNALLFGVIAVGLLAQRKAISRSERGAAVTWAATEEIRPIPKELRGVSTVWIGRLVLIVLGLVFLIVYPFMVSTGQVVDAGTIIVRGIAVLSLVVLTGWAGQVSLGQWAMVAVGSVVGGSLTAKVGLSFWLAVPATVVITAAIAVVVGLPALRIKGLFLMVSTFGFAIAVDSVLFDDRYFGWLLPGDAVERPTLLFVNFENERAMYFLCVAFLVVAIAVLLNLRRSRVGRLLIALRENEANVQSFGINVVRAKLIAFATSGALAGFSGVLFAHLSRGVVADSFSVDQNIFTFTAAIIGGVSSVGGALIGSTYFEVTGKVVASNQIAAFVFQNGGPILVLFAAPKGLMSIVAAGRDSVLRVIAQRRRIVVPSLFADYDPDVLERQLIPLGEPDLASGLAAVPVDERFALASELYKGRGERVIDKLGPKRETRDTVALRAAATAALDAESETRANAPVATGANGERGAR